MKILLTSLSIEAESRFVNNPNCAYPLGLAYIHATLEKDGHEVKTLFLNNFDHELAIKAIEDALIEWSPQVVGFQVFSMNRVSTYKVLDLMKNEYPHIRVILGGIHTSVMYRQLLERYPHAIAIIGEGELTFSELLKAIELRSPYEQIDGLAFMKGGKIILTRERCLIEDLDTLPFAKHEIFFDEEPRRTHAHIISSRGCPFNCNFCCLATISHRKWRPRDIGKVVEELVILKKKYPRLKYVQFHDDTLTLDNERTIELCKLLINANLSLKFTCSARIKPISREMLQWMAKAGFSKIMFGLETGSKRLLKSIHKDISPDDVIDLFKALREFDFNITTFLMCGFPGESDETVMETIQLVRTTQKIHYNYIAGIGKLLVYPGTEIYQIMKKAKGIDDDFWLTDRAAPYFTVEYPFSKLVDFENRIMNELSIDRVFTLQGFRRQFPFMWKEIVGYFFWHPRHFVSGVWHGIRRILEKIKIQIFNIQFSTLID